MSTSGTSGELPPSDGADDLRRHSSAVAAGILLSRIAGLGREVAFGHFLGAGMGADAFRAALRIPNLLQNLLGEGVLSASFIPVYSRMVAEGRREDAGRLAGAVVGLLLAVTSIIVAVGVVFAEELTRVFAPGFAADPEKFALTVDLVRIVTPGVGFLVLSAWCLGILNAHRRFFLSYVAPVIWNAAIVAALVTTALVTTAQVDLARAMAIGAAGGSLLQFVVQLPAVLRLSPGVRPTLRRTVPGLASVVRRFGQVVAGRGGVQLGGYLDLIVASLLAAGAVAALGYAQVLYLLPIGLFGMSVAAAELPGLSSMDHRDRAGVVARLDQGLGRVAFFVTPAMVAFLVAGDLVVASIFQRGRFSADTAVQVGTILAVYALGLIASTSGRLLQSALYGVGDARSPALYAVGRVVVALLVGIAAMLPLDGVRATTTGFELVGDLGWSLPTEAERQGGDQLRLGAAGLAFGAAVGAWVELALLRARIRTLFGRPRLGGPSAPAIALGGIIAAIAALATRPLLATSALPATARGVVVLVVVSLAYLLVTRLRGVPEAAEVLGRLRHPFHRSSAGSQP